MIKKAKNTRQIIELPIVRGKLHISHLFFADDCLLYCQATDSEWRKTMKIVKHYEEASGQRMNKDKSSLFFSKNTSTLTRNSIARMAGIRVRNS